jgi:hypothetical protein
MLSNDMILAAKYDKNDEDFIYAVAGGGSKYCMPSEVVTRR